ncbi:methyltransferase, FxLD system [Actinoplanes sp. TRM 88003]|uniref:Protein-L-isoaspartate O-methyltransferase n=1 Tax=Paractinoplanes aksuensis TaxID=2939490 RepID=A0ABT1DSK8_9ACTN|nr:methyltransferase, FxLD system [Actinoplanes aksuensis]MCO8273830.1 methyltransferase, FxLD system [Actinoplanes aksuensis]
MIEQARLRPGSRVLEVGSGGCNAALLAEVVGPTGTTVTVDIDPRVTAGARSALIQAGYPQVRVLQADGADGYPADGPYDAIIVTVESSDIPPAWLEHLPPSGALVVPLRMRGHTRCLTLRRRDDHLLATKAIQCGFVPMQGLGRDPARRIPLRGEDAVLLLDDRTTEVDETLLRAALDMPRVDLWSPVSAAMSDGKAFDSVQLWLASQPRPYGILNVDRNRTAGLLDPQDRFFCPTLLSSDSLAYLTLRENSGQNWQFGAHGFGPAAETLAAEIIMLLTAWNDHHRSTGPQITIHPSGSALPDADGLRLLVPRRHSLTAISWF